MKILRVVTAAGDSFYFADIAFKALTRSVEEGLMWTIRGEFNNETTVQIFEIVPRKIGDLRKCCVINFCQFLIEKDLCFHLLYYRIGDAVVHVQ